MSVTAPDFTKAPPRQGREMLGGYAWLARMADKIRAVQAGTNADYVGFCGLSKGFLERCSVGVDDFDSLIAQGATDHQLVIYFDRHVTVEQQTVANRFVLEERADNLAKQDEEEGYTAGRASRA
jgi:hypothetical protein